MMPIQGPDMQAVRRRIKTDIGGRDAVRAIGIQLRYVRRLLDITALIQRAQEIGFVVAHHIHPW